MTMKDQDGRELIGYIDIGGMAVSRAALAQRLPDMARFERCLDDALRVDAYMTAHDGAVPSYLDSWPAGKRNDVADTLREVGQVLHGAAAGLLAAAEQRASA